MAFKLAESAQDRRSGQRAPSHCPLRVEAIFVNGKLAERLGEAALWCQPSSSGSVASDFYPLLDLALIGSGCSGQLGLRAVSRREGRHASLGQAERDASQLGEQVGPVASDLTKLGHSLLHVVDLAAASVARCHGGDPRSQDLVGCAHAWSLEPNRLAARTSWAVSSIAGEVALRRTHRRLIAPGAEDNLAGKPAPPGAPASAQPPSIAAPRPAGAPAHRHAVAPSVARSLVMSVERRS